MEDQCPLDCLYAREISDLLSDFTRMLDILFSDPRQRETTFPKLASWVVLPHRLIILLE